MKTTPLLLAAFMAFAAVDVAAQNAREVEPRFGSLRSDEVNVRKGPGLSFPIQWVFRRRNLPVIITAEVDNWRRIRDFEGEEGWVEGSLISTRQSALVQGDGLQELFEEADDGSDLIAQVEPGVTARIVECRGGEWCQLDTSAGRGWMKADVLWGALEP
ncbi:MAG: SH3 domain-containing protein [Pseudomonadota bacterium]